MLNRSFTIAIASILFLGSSFLSANERPNIVMIISDDHAWTDYGFMGHPQIQTPNIDRMAQNSLTFRRGYVTSSLCCPSLASIITGLYPHQHKITSNDPPIPEGMTNAQFQRSPEFQQGRERMNKHLEACTTLPNLLKDQGYRSLQTGKWWQGNFARGGFTHGMTKGGRHGDEGLTIGRKSMSPIMDFMDESIAAKNPFMVWYAPLMPHDPHTPPDRLLEKYKDKTESIHVARYWAMIEWFDETVGELMNGLQERGQLENTIVVYVADNGWIQSPDNTRFAPKSKQSQYDGGLRSPIMVQWPNKIAARMSNDLAQSIDLMPTLRSALGLPKDPALPGIDLLDGKAVAARKTLFGECFTHNFNDLDRPEKNLRWRWIVEDQSKLILSNPSVEKSGGVELYRLDADPQETTNLAASSPERVADLKQKLDRWWLPISDKP
jgi:uncharacterized sulfatase